MIYFALWKFGGMSNEEKTMIKKIIEVTEDNLNEGVNRFKKVYRNLFKTTEQRK